MEVNSANREPHCLKCGFLICSCRETEERITAHLPWLRAAYPNASETLLVLIAGLSGINSSLSGIDYEN